MAHMISFSPLLSFCLLIGIFIRPFAFNIIVNMLRQACHLIFCIMSILFFLIALCSFSFFSVG